MKNLKKMIALLMCLILSLGTFANAEEAVLISAPPARDYEGHWAQATIQKWLDAGKVSGYPDGSYKPDSNVTRAEFVKMVNGIIDFNKKAVITYKDVPASEWFYDYIGVAQEVGYISGYSSDKFGPNDYITREQAASILSRIQYLDNNESALNKFADNLSISAWAKGSVGAASNSGFISGYTDGSFKPVNNLTRAEALTMIDNVMVNGKNYIVYNAGTILKDTVVEGDLIIAKTVGKGDVSLTNMLVKGKIKILGGQVTLSGKYKEVIASGDSDLNLDGAEIESLTIEKPIVLRGKGKVKNLNANADGIKYEKDVDLGKVVLGTGVTLKPALEGEEVPAGGGGGGGGTGPGGETATNKISISAAIDGKNYDLLTTSSYDGTKNISTFLRDEAVTVLNTGEPDITGYFSKFNDKIGNLKISGIQVNTPEGLSKIKEDLSTTEIVKGISDDIFNDSKISESEMKAIIKAFALSDLDKLTSIDLTRTVEYGGNLVNPVFKLKDEVKTKEEIRNFIISAGKLNINNFFTQNGDTVKLEIIDNGKTMSFTITKNK